MKKITVLIYNPYNGIMGIRARNLFNDFPKDLKINLVYRKSNNIIDAIRFFFITLFSRPDLIYMMDIGIPSFIATFFTKYFSFKKVKVFLDTGDLVYLFSSAEKKRNVIIRNVVYYTEEWSLKIADTIVTRGTYHKEYLKEKGFNNVEYVTDGVITDLFKPKDVSSLRKELGLDDVTTIGVMGNLFWISEWEWCYGWYMIHALPYLKDEKIKAIVVGSGDGLERLKAKSKELGVEENIIFTGRVPHEKVVDYLNLIDIFIFTQPHHIQTKIRTCAKIPEIFAVGNFVISTDIEEPMKLIKENGLILQFKGIKDNYYPKRLAEAIKNVINEGDFKSKGLLGRKIAKNNFEYSKLSERLQKIILGNEK